MAVSEHEIEEFEKYQPYCDTHLGDDDKALLELVVANALRYYNNR